MSDAPDPTSNPEGATAADAVPATKKPLISLPFIVIVVLLGVGAYFAAPWFMTQYLYQVEEGKKNRSVLPGANVGEISPKVVIDPDNPPPGHGDPSVGGGPVSAGIGGAESPGADRDSGRPESD